MIEIITMRNEMRIEIITMRIEIITMRNEMLKFKFKKKFLGKLL